MPQNPADSPAASSNRPPANNSADSWHLGSLDDVWQRLESSEQGLPQEEARKRLERFGLNELMTRKRTSAWKRLLLQFHNPLIYVLLATAGLTALLHHWVDTGVIVGVVIINALIGFFQESKAENAIQSLQQMLAPNARVLRQGTKTNIPAVELVPGDVMFLEGGDKVPADIRLVRSKNLRIEEAALTGESLPSEKSPATLATDVSLADRKNMTFAGTLVTTGTATGVVVATGDATQIGQIAGMLQQVESVETPLTKRLAEFSKIITIVIIGFCVLVFGAGTLTGIDWVDMLMVAVALAVSAIPEGLPAIMTIGLAIGVKRMASQNAVIRRLPAVEALGSATVICTDKTGTLTRNEMTVTAVKCFAGEFQFEGVGYRPEGAVRTEAGQAADPQQAPELRRLLMAGVLCNDSTLSETNDRWGIEGDPTEAALLVAAEKAGVRRSELLSEWPRMDEIPFESEQQYMATLHHQRDGEQACIFLKGSPERVLARCQTLSGTEQPWDAAPWEVRISEMAATGLRILALAEKTVSLQQRELELSHVESGFSLLGVVGMIDPPREEAVEAVRKCRDAGIRVKMITGDHLATARTIAGQIGIDNELAMSGLDVDKLSESEFDEAVVRVDVFARVSPSHKLQFVRSLQKQGHVVAMTGDGVNDAPALKQADIGAAMGINGTEVAKEAAEMVLLDDNFASIERAVEEGRTVFDNLQKTILFILPTNGGECLTLVAALILGVMLPILPLHILWINLITTVALAITLAFDPMEDDVMQRPPRRPGEPLIGRQLMWRIVSVSILMAIGTFGLFNYEMQSGSGEQVARSVAVNAIVCFEIFYLFNSRRLTNSVLNPSGIFGNPVALGGIVLVIVFQMLFTYWPLMHSLFKVGPLTAMMWVRIVLCGIVLLLFVEAEKFILNRMIKR